MTNETKIPKCPKCKEEIESLTYSKTKEVFGEFKVDDAGDMEYLEEYDICEEQKSYNYSCPSCDKVLFTDDEEAEEFLKGK